jgi:hypothetical protein
VAPKRRAPLHEQAPLFLQLLNFPTRQADWVVYVLDVILIFLVGGACTLILDLCAYPPDLKGGTGRPDSGLY